MHMHVLHTVDGGPSASVRGCRDISHSRTGAPISWPPVTARCTGPLGAFRGGPLGPFRPRCAVGDRWADMFSLFYWALALTLN